MADCSANTLAAASGLLEQKLTHKQLLAAAVYLLCVQNSMSCTPSSLASASGQLACCMTEKQLLAAAVYLLCVGGGGAGGGNTNTFALTDPVGNGTTKGDLWTNYGGPVVLLWQWDGSAWQPIIGP